MTIDSIDCIIYTSYFLIPGFIVAETTNTMIPSKRRSDAEKVLVYLGYSILNFGCWFWAFYLISKQFAIRNSLYWLCLIVLVIITGTITGIIIGVLKKHSPIRWIMGKHNVMTEHPIPTAWEYKFSQLKEGERLTVHLDDGTVIRGLFYNKSFASSDMEKRDLFIEEVCMLIDDKWKPVEGSDGVWISSGAIKWISFFKEGETTK